MSFGIPFGRIMSEISAQLPATTITPPGPVGEPSDIQIVGANGSRGDTGPSESDDPPPVFTFEQEQSLLIKMNEQQGKTIEELQKRVKHLEQQLLERPVPPICYIRCAHCHEEPVDE